MEFMKNWKILVINISDCRLNGGDTQKTHRNDDFTWSGVDPITNGYSWTGIHQTPRHSTEHLEKKNHYVEYETKTKDGYFHQLLLNCQQLLFREENLISLRGWMAS